MCETEEPPAPLPPSEQAMVASQPSETLPQPLEQGVLRGTALVSKWLCNYHFLVSHSVWYVQPLE